jgi:hypothetical protein
MRTGTIKPDTQAASATKRLTLRHLRRAAPVSFSLLRFPAATAIHRTLTWMLPATRTSV